jgi:small subunit ribosomal protein S6
VLARWANHHARLDRAQITVRLRCAASANNEKGVSDVALYEHVFIARQDVSQAEAEELANEFAGIVKEKGGKVLKTESWGLRSLAYKIDKNRKGHYTLLGLQAPAEAIQELERRERIHDSVLRFMTVRVDEISDEPSAILRSKDDRKRDRRGGKGE